MPRKQRTPNDAEQSPSTGPDARIQTHFWLAEHELELLDRWEYELRLGGWRAANRSAMMRAILACLRDVPVEVGGILSEEQLAAHFQIVLDQHQT